MKQESRQQTLKRANEWWKKKCDLPTPNISALNKVAGKGFQKMQFKKKKKTPAGVLQNVFFMLGVFTCWQVPLLTIPAPTFTQEKYMFPLKS